MNFFNQANVFYQPNPPNDLFSFWAQRSYPIQNYMPNYIDLNSFYSFLYHATHQPENEVKREQTNYTIVHSSLSEIILQSKEDPTVDKQQKNSIVRKITKKDVNYITKYQKVDRNLNAIVLRNFVNYIHGDPNSYNIINKIIEKQKLSLCASYYLELFKQSLPAKQSYVGVGKMKNFIDLDKQNYGIKLITLILLRKFVQIDFYTVLNHSKKVSRSAREKQLKHGKTFLKFFIRQCI